MPQHRSVSRRPGTGAFPDAPARERFPAPRHRSGLRKTTGQEAAQAETLVAPDSRPLAGTPETQLLGGSSLGNRYRDWLRGACSLRE